MPALKIANKVINDNSDAYVIAEIGHNHQGSLAKCFQMIHSAFECGCDAVKLQKRNNKKLFTKGLYDSPYDNENSFGKTYGEHREALEFDWNEYRGIKEYCSEVGIDLIVTPFDFDSADFCEKLGIAAFKTSSADMTNTPLLQHIAQFQKPMIVSTGGGVIGDIIRAHDSVIPLNRQISLLHCTAAYPVYDYAEMNLRVIEYLRRKFDRVIGLSAHDSGIAMAVAAYVLGARIIEKHFTLHRALRGTDHAFSLDPQGMDKMINYLKTTRIALGDGIKKIYPSEEKPIYKMGKGLYAAKDLPKGKVLGADDIAIKSPKANYEPYEIGSLLGFKLAKDLKEDEPITISCLNY